MDKHKAKLQTWPFGEIESSLVQVQFRGLRRKLPISLKPGWQCTHPELADVLCLPGRAAMSPAVTRGHALPLAAWLRLAEQHKQQPRCHWAAAPETSSQTSANGARLYDVRSALSKPDSAELLVAPHPPSTAGAGFGHLSNPSASTSGEHIAPGLGQPNPFPSPQRKGKEGGRLWAWVISCS